MIEDNEDEDIEKLSEKPSLSRKKLILVLLPILIVIGLSVGIYFTINNNLESFNGSYNVVKNSNETVTVLYDLPEIKTIINKEHTPHHLNMKINLELSSIEDLKTIEAILPRLTDIIISHTIELSVHEVEGSAGLYWLKEELLYRINLSTYPVKIKTLNFRTFELEPQKEKD